MSIEVLPLKRASICACGYGVLKPQIQVGTKYRIDRASVKLGMYRCGGCGNWQGPIPIANANSILNPHADMSPLPMGLFR